MKILGIDPGYAIMGYGVIEVTGNRFRVCRYGSITTEAGRPIEERLSHLYDSLREIIEEEKPDAASIEELFFNRNVTTAIEVGEARGIAVLACAKGGLEIAEYTPMQIKQALVGYGKAEKRQVQIMVKTLLNLKEIPRPDDTADALAAAICHAHSAGTSGRLKELMKR